MHSFFFFKIPYPRTWWWCCDVEGRTLAYGFGIGIIEFGFGFGFCIIVDVDVDMEGFWILMTILFFISYCRLQNFINYITRELHQFLLRQAVNIYAKLNFNRFHKFLNLKFEDTFGNTGLLRKTIKISKIYLTIHPTCCWRCGHLLIWLLLTLIWLVLILKERRTSHAGRIVDQQNAVPENKVLENLSIFQTFQNHSKIASPVFAA